MPSSRTRAVFGWLIIFLILSSRGACAAPSLKPELAIYPSLGNVSLLAISPDGKTLASGGYDQSVNLWDAPALTWKRTLALPDESLHFLAFSSSGDTLTAAGTGSLSDPARTNAWLKIWEVRSGRLVHALEFESLVDSIACSPDGRQVALLVRRPITQTRPSFGKVEIRDARDSTLLGSSVITDYHSRRVFFSPDGSQLCGAGTAGGFSHEIGKAWRNDVLLWKLESGKLVTRTLPVANNLELAVFSPDGKTLVGAGYRYEGKSDNYSEKAELIFWDVDSRQVTKTIPVEKSVAALSFAVNGETVATGGDGYLTLWDIHTGKSQVEPGQAGIFIRCALFSQAGDRLYISGRNLPRNAITSPSSETSFIKTRGILERSWTSLYGEGISYVSPRSFLLDDKKTMAVDSTDESFQIWNLETMQWKKEYKNNEQVGDVKVLSGDGKYLVRSVRLKAFQREWQVWNTQTNKLISKIKVPGGGLVWAHGGYFSHDGKRLVIVDASDAVGYGGAMVSDVATGKKVYDFKGLNRLAECVAFSPDDKTIAMGTWSKEVSLWDAATGKSRGKRLVLHKGVVVAVAYSSDGTTLVSCDERGEIAVWDARTYKLRRSWHTGHARRCHIAISPDGKLLATGGDDSVVKVWQLSTGNQLKSFQRPQKSGSLFFLPGSRILASANRGSGVEFWDTASERLVLTVYDYRTLLPELSKDLHIAYTPQGYYTATPREHSMVTWRVGDKLYPASSYSREYYRPDLVQATLR